MAPPKSFIKKDSNHDDLVNELRILGISVTELHKHGAGVPDIICGYAGINVFAEIKNPSHLNGLTPAQRTWHKEWLGQVKVVYHPQEVVEEILKELKKINYSSAKVQAVLLDNKAKQRWGNTWRKK